MGLQLGFRLTKASTPGGRGTEAQHLLRQAVDVFLRRLLTALLVLLVLLLSGPLLANQGLVLPVRAPAVRKSPCSRCTSSGTVTSSPLLLGPSAELTWPKRAGQAGVCNAGLDYFRNVGADMRSPVVGMLSRATSVLCALSQGSC